LVPQTFQSKEMKSCFFLLVVLVTFTFAQESTPTSSVLFCNITRVCDSPSVNITELIRDVLIPGLRKEFVSNHTDYFLELFYNITLSPKEQRNMDKITAKFESHFIPWLYRALNESNQIGVLASTSVSSVGSINYDMEANILSPLRVSLVNEFNAFFSTLSVSETEVLRQMEVIKSTILAAVRREDDLASAAIQRILISVKTTLSDNSRIGYQKIEKTTNDVIQSMLKEMETTTDKLVILTENLQKDSDVLIEDKKVESIKKVKKMRGDFNETSETIENEMNLMIQETKEKSMNLLLDTMRRYETETEEMRVKIQESVATNTLVFMEIAISTTWIYLMFMVSFKMLPSKDDLKTFSPMKFIPIFLRKVLQMAPSNILFPSLILLFEYKFENLNEIGLGAKLYIVVLLVLQVLIFGSLLLFSMILLSFAFVIRWCIQENPLEMMKSKFHNFIQNLWVHQENQKISNEGNVDYESNEYY
jgi:hypothetical protein